MGENNCIRLVKRVQDLKGVYLRGGRGKEKKKAE